MNCWRWSDERIRENRGRNRIHENDAYETLKEERKRHGSSKTAEELESYLYGLTCAVDIVEKYVDKENGNERIREDFGRDRQYGENIC